MASKLVAALSTAALEVKLSAADLARLNEVFPADAAAGQRYPESMMAIVNG